MEIVDLSHVIETGMQVFPGDPEVCIQTALTVEDAGVNVLAVSMGSQSGTHVDSPFHVRNDLPTLDQITLDRFIGPFTLINASTVGTRETIPHELFEVVEKFEPIVLVRTDWSDHFNTPHYLAHPVLSLATITYLLQQGVRTIGLDFLSLDATPHDVTTMTLDNHYCWSEAGGVIVENLTNLRSITTTTNWVSLLPLRLGATDGAPIRAIAFAH